LTTVAAGPHWARRALAASDLLRAQDGHHPKRFLHDQRLTLDETGSANFVLDQKISKQLRNVQPC
jgi:hypothetical protein